MAIELPNLNPDDQFLASATHSYSYGDLARFVHYLTDFFATEVSVFRPLGIWADSSDLTVFLVAACWVQNIPFVCLNPNAKPATLRNRIDTLQPALICAGSRKAEQQLKPFSTDFTRLNLSTILAADHYPVNLYDKESTAQPGDIFGFFFTSGTSASPKIVPLKRRQMFAAARASAKNLKPQPNHYWLLCMPLHHIGGVSLILRSLIYGSAVYRMPKFDAPLAAKHLAQNQRISVASLVPTMLKRLLEDPSFTTHNKFNGILLGGGPIATDLLRECVQRKIPVIPSFGMTETCAQIAANPITPGRAKNNFRSVGPVFEPNCIEIRDEFNQPITANNAGIIWLKGPQIFDGYWNEENNETVFDKNGWFNTGDFGRLDKENQLYIEARRTDLIITGGENVSPFEIENALEKLPAIKEAAVFGMPDPEWGQRMVAAIVTPKKKKTSAKSIQKNLQNSLPGFKIPKQFIFVDTLPRTETGKIKRAALSALLNQTCD